MGQPQTVVNLFRAMAMRKALNDGKEDVNGSQYGLIPFYKRASILTSCVPAKEMVAEHTQALDDEEAQESNDRHSHNGIFG
jgi:hypothetical protein